MKFVDEVRIQVKAGDGGHGAIAFRREKFIERGGPSGGDGGNGGSVVLLAEPQLTTLLDYRYQQHHRARPGQNGMGSDCNGVSAEDLILKVPLGTLVRDAGSGELLKDLSLPGERFVVAQGGRGGLGNMNFANSTRQTPRFAQDGTLGEEKTLVLELKLLADVGLLGFTNAGKSTLIARVSRARPKIADYPFTTLVPNLGVVPYKDSQSFVMADIPGLIEGASEGLGLGHQFLRHVERCRVLVHLVDLSAEGEGREPLSDWTIINRELMKYSSGLSEKPQIVVASKLDLPVSRERLPDFTAAMGRKGLQVFPISAATGEGVGPLLDAVARVLWGRPQESWEDGLRIARPPSVEEGAPVAGQTGESKPGDDSRLEKAQAEQVKAPGPLGPVRKKPVGRAKAAVRSAKPVGRAKAAVRSAKPVGRAKAAVRSAKPARQVKAEFHPTKPSRGTKAAVRSTGPAVKAKRAIPSVKPAQGAKGVRRSATLEGTKGRGAKPASRAAKSSVVKGSAVRSMSSVAKARALKSAAKSPARLAKGSPGQSVARAKTSAPKKTAPRGPGVRRK